VILKRLQLMHGFAPRRTVFPITKEDRLGLGVIYVQAKRWKQVIGRPEVQRFAGALAGQHATKGIFITTSSFTGRGAWVRINARD
jgi:restriction endonuclease Mrr